MVLKVLDLFQRIYRLKTVLLSLMTALFGLALLLLAKWADRSGSGSWVNYLPIGEIGSTLFVTGALVIAWDYFDARDKERRDDERIRRLLKESAPEFRDAVVQGFAVSSDDLKRVATPELLDGIAKNVLALRLGDRDFAEEVYEDVRDQAIRARERWYDVDVSIRLSGMDEDSATGAARFDVLISWEYTVTPSHPVQRFACVSDRDEFHELVTDIPATLTWFMTPRPGFNASERSAFELLQFSVDGEARRIRRAARRTGQTYSASIGEDVVRACKPVRVKHVYRTITPQSGHRLFVEISQPAKGLSLELDYSNTAIAHMSVTDLVTSTRKTQISRLPEQVDAKVLSADLSGWLLPKAGFTFVWTLASELPRGSAADVPGQSGPAEDAA